MTWLVSVARDINNKIYLQEKGRKICEKSFEKKVKHACSDLQARITKNQ